MLENQIQKNINEICYWDDKILDLQIKYFGDEVELFLEKDNEYVTSIRFVFCEKIKLDMDSVNRWQSRSIKTMKYSQLGFFVQNIEVKKSDLEEYHQINIDLSEMNIQIICKYVYIEKIQKKNLDFFWNENS